MSYEDFYRLVSDFYHGQPTKGDIRLGQMYFNTLNEVRPNIASLLRGSIRDPFHKSTISDEVHEFVKSRW